MKAWLDQTKYILHVFFINFICTGDGRPFVTFRCLFLWWSHLWYLTFSFIFILREGYFIFLWRLNHLETLTTIKRKQTRKNPRITEFLPWAGGGGEGGPVQYLPCGAGRCDTTPTNMKCWFRYLWTGTGSLECTRCWCKMEQCLATPPTWKWE